MKKTEKQPWEEIESDLSIWCKEGSEVSCNNYVVREIINKTDMQTAMLYLIILSHRDIKTNICAVTFNDLAKECATSPKSIGAKIRSLEKNDFLLTTTGKMGNSNTYFFPKEKFFHRFDSDRKQQEALNNKNKPKNKKEFGKAEKPIPGIYLISNTITHTQYVGQAVDIRKRWVEHIRDLRNNTHCNKSLQADFNQYGEESFEFKILETIEDSPVLDIELDRKEGYWGKKLNVLSDGYNEAKFHDPFKD